MLQRFIQDDLAMYSERLIKTKLKKKIRPTALQVRQLKPQSGREFCFQIVQDKNLLSLHHLTHCR